MERVTISLDDELLSQFDQLIHRKGYANRSEAIRDVLRQALQAERMAEDSPESAHCVGALIYVYNHHERDLARRLTETHHAHHDLIRATTHIHLDHENCLEVSLMEGPTDAVRTLANTITAETGVRHGKAHLVPVTVGHRHDPHDHHHHGHDHKTPVV